MPAGVGETLLTTLFADCHYYFSEPPSKPPHHRFDRGSYVYLFHNPTTRQAKIEVANNAGTAEQDAFYGYLNVANVAYSYLQPTLCTLFINTGAVQDSSTWHLPTLDPRNEAKYSYKLHAMDIYFWTEKDAGTFLGHLKGILGGDKFDIKHAPPPSSNIGSPHSEHRDSMSPVVQLLEKTAVGTHFPPRAASTVSAQSFPGPPTPATSGGASPNPAPAPMAYNPAAPAAPEPVQYREKTPPPPDDGSGTGLANAAKYDSVPQQQQQSQYGPSPGISYQSTAQPNYFSGPPQQPHHQARQSSQTMFPGPPPQSLASMESVPRTFSGSVPPPPPGQQQQQRAPSFGPMAQSTLPQSPPPGQQSFHRQSVVPQAQHAVYTPGQPQYANYPASPGFQSSQTAPPAYGTPLQSPGFPGPPPPPQQQQHHQQTPVGGYSNYSYSSSQTPQQGGEFGGHVGGGYQGDIHSQVYRPTEVEAQSLHGKTASSSTASGGSGKVGKVEGNVNKYLKKLDKLW